MGDATEDVPKAFIEVGGRTLYERQREAVADHVEGVTVVLGYEAENASEHLSSAETVVLDRWYDYDNAESLRRALADIDDDALVLNGDVVVGPSVVDRLVGRYESLGGACNVVGCLPGVQTEHTAIRCDDAGNVVEYGMIPGHRHAGVGIVSDRHREEAMAVLDRNCEGWYPHIYPETPTKRVAVPADSHLEINRPADLETAREQSLLAGQTEWDVAP
jgi:choline kinase